MKTEGRALLLLFLSVAVAVQVLPNPAEAATWGAATPLPGADPNSNYFPSLLTTSWGDVWLAWTKSSPGDFGAIYLMIHNRYGWSGETLLENGNTGNIDPVLAQLRNGTIILAWSSNRCNCATGYDIYMKSYNGTGWSNPVPIVQGTGDDLGPALATLRDGRVIMVWSRMSPATGNGDLYYKFYNGTWGPEQPLVITSANEETEPTVRQAPDGKIWVIFEANYNIHAQLFYKVWDGTTWSNTVQFTNDANNDRWPSVAVDRGGTLWAYFSRRLPYAPATPPWQWDLFYKNSTDNGATWSPDQQVASDPANDENPSVVQAPDKTLWVVWDSTRSLGNPYGTPNLYMIQSSLIPAHDLAVTGIQKSLKNPRAGEKMNVTATITNLGDFPDNSTVSLYVNSALYGSKPVTLAQGQSIGVTFTWDSTGYNPQRCTFAVHVNPVKGELALQNNWLNSTFLLTFRGDVNRDGTVDIVDLSTIATHFGTILGSGGYLADADLNKDGVINIVDLSICGSDFGKYV